MPLSSYGLLVGRAVDHRREGNSTTPHFQVLLDAAGTRYRAAVNVRSQEAPSELLYLLDDDLQHPVTASISALADGWTALPSTPNGAALDYIRGNLFDPRDMRALPHDADGPDNDLPDLLEHYVERATADPLARIYVFGQRWGPEQGTRDKIFGFVPGNGVHDVHMNQGNSEAFRRDDGVWQDGAMLLHFPGEPRWVGIFLAFQSQAWHTDDRTGHRLDDPVPSRTEDPVVRILAALVNAPGPAPEAESVLLLNASPEPVDLTGWQLLDRSKRASEVPVGVLPAGASLAVALDGQAQLGNNGGAITLVDTAGLKVHGVTYTAEQARPEGWTVTF
jgi:uncharacterized protein YukJ